MLFEHPLPPSVEMLVVLISLFHNRIYGQYISSTYTCAGNKQRMNDSGIASTQL
jgi:hypothetical protein